MLGYPATRLSAVAAMFLMRRATPLPDPSARLTRIHDWALFQVARAYAQSLRS